MDAFDFELKIQLLNNSTLEVNLQNYVW